MFKILVIDDDPAICELLKRLLRKQGYLAMYLLDVAGNGLKAALPSVSVLNLLRSRAIPNINYYQPSDVLRAFNATFQMSYQNDRYFTILYGV